MMVYKHLKNISKMVDVTTFSLAVKGRKFDPAASCPQTNERYRLEISSAMKRRYDKSRLIHPGIRRLRTGEDLTCMN